MENKPECICISDKDCEYCEYCKSKKKEKDV